jgi:hypothetical protein
VQALALALQRELVRALRERGAGAKGEELAVALEAEDPALLLEGGAHALLRLLFQDRGSTWARTLREIAMRGHARDLEGLLLDALPVLSAGEQRDTALRALRSLDLERVLQHARRESSEPMHRWFLVPDGNARARVDLLLEHRRGESGSDAEREGLASRPRRRFPRARPRVEPTSSCDVGTWCCVWRPSARPPSLD